VGRGKLIGFKITNATSNVRVEIAYVVLKCVLEGTK
jgi:hypothetical protein